MKPSEALRKGMAMVQGQAIGRLYRKDSDTACAWGCILLGQGKTKEELKSHLPLDQTLEKKYFQYYGRWITTDNDFCKTSLDEIAQRLEAIGE